MELRREVRWKPRDSHAMCVRFLLHGDLGATQFLVQFLVEPYGEPLFDSRLVRGWDLGFHSRREIGYATAMEKCDVVPEGRCWYDGSSLQADELCEQFLKEGEQVVWDTLEDRYRIWLAEADDA